MIPMTATGLAKFITANHTEQRRIVWNYKYPDPEGRAQAAFYRDARRYLRKYHEESRNRTWLIEIADALKNEASLFSRARKTRLNSNAKSLCDYERFFGDNGHYSLLDDVSLGILVGNIKISLKPDLVVEEKSGCKLIKFLFSNFSNEERAQQICRSISQMMFEAQVAKGLALPSSAVVILDLPHGKVVKGARMGSRMSREIEAACKNIEAIWNDLDLKAAA